MNFLSRIISPTESFSASAEIWSDGFLFAFTLSALAFIAAEYAAEHLDWPWGKAHKHIFAIVVIVAFSGELLSETGSFWFSYTLQSSQTDQLATLTPRELTKQQQDEIRATIFGNFDKSVLLQSYALDAESGRFAGQLKDSLAQSVQVVDALMQESVTGPVATGVHVWGPNKALVSLLLASFHDQGILVSAQPVTFSGSGFHVSPPPNVDAIVFVGAKPIRK